MRINYTWPGRFHLIRRDKRTWITLWLFGWRLHYSNFDRGDQTMTYYFDDTRSSEAWNACRNLMVFLFLIATLLGGAFATLVILFYMEDINPAYSLTALGVYAYTAGAAMWVMLNRVNNA